MATETAAKTKFVLREVTKERKRPLWFQQMTAIGPMTTADPGKRAEFDSRDEALRCPCRHHNLTFWQIEEVRGSMPTSPTPELHGHEREVFSDGGEGEATYVERVTTDRAHAASLMSAYGVEVEPANLAAIHMRFRTTDPCPGGFWFECPADHPDAVPFWKDAP